jgi:hypothetical protein
MINNYNNRNQSRTRLDEVPPIIVEIVDSYDDQNSRSGHHFSMAFILYLLSIASAQDIGES